MLGHRVEPISEKEQMDYVLDLIRNPPMLSTKHDDSFADRLNSRYTIIILMVFATVVSVQIYVGEPITCWAPQHFTENHVTYTNSYCWIKNTYYLPLEDAIPQPGEHRDTVTYYQWVPFILIAMSALFYFPSIVWHGLNQRSGVDADNILESAQKLTKVDQQEEESGEDQEEENSHEKTLEILTSLIHRFLGKKRLDSEESTWCRGTRRFGSYLVLLYVIVKLLYILNVLLQFFLLDIVLTTQYEAYGIDVMGGAISDTDWTLTPKVPFPRVTMCDFEVRRLGNVHRYTVQCTLPINLYNEKIFLVLWFWLIFVCIVNVIEFFSWTYRGFVLSDGKRYISDHIKFAASDPDELEESKKIKPESVEGLKKLFPSDLNEFVESYLKRDGVFLLRLIGHNTNKLSVNELILSLWNLWYVGRNKSELNGVEVEKAKDAADEKALLKQQRLK